MYVAVGKQGDFAAWAVQRERRSKTGAPARTRRPHPLPQKRRGRRLEILSARGSRDSRLSPHHLLYFAESQAPSNARRSPKENGMRQAFMSIEKGFMTYSEGMTRGATNVELGDPEAHVGLLGSTFVAPRVIPSE